MGQGPQPLQHESERCCLHWWGVLSQGVLPCRYLASSTERGARMRGSGVKPVCGYVPAGPNGMNRECDPVYNRWSICKGSAQRCKVATNVLDCHQPPGISYPGQQHLHPQGCVPAMPCYIAQSCPWIPVPLLCHEMHTQPPCMRMLILYSAIWKILIMVGAFCIQCWT